MTEYSSKKQRTEYPHVTPERFVETWQKSEDADEVAQKLNMPKAIVHARASKYRGQGIHLKNMKRKSKEPLDVPRLNKMIQNMAEANGQASEFAGPKAKEEPRLPDDKVESLMAEVLKSLHQGKAQEG